MKYKYRLFLSLSLSVLVVGGLAAQDSDAQGRGASLFLSPPSGTFLSGSTFDVSIFVDTRGVAVNSIELNLKFPPDKLQITKPSTGKSFISIWASPPIYSNEKGILSFSGGLPSPGINTSSGLISTVTFRARSSGTAKIEILSSSKVLANDGKGTNILQSIIQGVYVIKPKPPDGPSVFSQTHPDESKWYNNNNFVIGWEGERGVSDYSFILDSFPQTTPDNTPETKDSATAFETVEDGFWYFHIKARKMGVWGAPSHFLIRVDTTPPAAFKPKIDVFSAAISKRALVTFFTTDAFSGIDHYEVAVIDREYSASISSPVFVESESPYQLPRDTSENVRIIVRAVDGAGNIREATIDASIGKSFIALQFLGRNDVLWAIMIVVLLALFAFWARHFLFRHKIMDRVIQAKNVLLGKPEEKKALWSTVTFKNLRKIKKSDTQKDTKIFEKKNFKADEMKQKLAEGVAEDTPRVSESLEGKSLEKIAKTATKTEDRIAATRLLVDSHKLTKQGFDKIQPILRNYGQEVYVLKRQLQLATTDQIADIVKKMSRDDHGKTDVAIFDSPNFIEYYKNLTLEGFIETLKSPAFRVKWTAKFSDPSFDAKQNVKVSAYNSDAQRRGGRPFVPGV